MSIYYQYQDYINAMRLAEHINTKVAAYNSILYLDKLAAGQARNVRKGRKRVVKQKAAGQTGNIHPWTRKTRAGDRGMVENVLNRYHPKFKKLIPKSPIFGKAGGKWGMIAGGTAAALGLGYGAYAATRPKKQPWYRSREVHAGIGALTGSLLGAGAGNTIAGRRGRLPGAAAGAAGGGYLAYTQSDNINKFLDSFGG